LIRSFATTLPKEINWERSEYESRVDVAADDIEAFVDAVLDTIDVEAARSSPARWEIVCRYFAGSARAAKAQGNTPNAGGKRIAAYLATEFSHARDDGSSEGFFEFMDWLANPDGFQPTALRSLLKS
jgi:hypothetical protein